MVLSEVVQGGDAYARTRKLVADSAQTDEEKAALRVRADEIFQTLIDADVVERLEGRGRRGSVRDHRGRAGGLRARQPLSPFLAGGALNFWIPRTKATRSTSSRLPRPRWKTRGRYCALRSGPRATRRWPR